MREVEANSLLVNVRACLLNVSSENRTQSRLKKMAGRVVSSYRVTAVRVYRKIKHITNLNDTGLNLYLVQIHSVYLLSIYNGKRNSVCGDNAGITNLTAAFSVKYCGVEYESTFTLAHLLKSLIGSYNSEKLCRARISLISKEVCFGKIFEKRLRRISPAGNITSCLSCASLLLLHKSRKFLFVYRKSALVSYLTSEIYRETEGIVKLERISSGNGALSLSLNRLKYSRKDCKTGVNRNVESILFKRNNLKDIILLCYELGISRLVLRNNYLAKLGHKLFVYTKELTVTASAAKNSAENVTTSLVRGDNAVANHKRCASYMVGNNSYRNVVVLIITVFFACNFANGIEYLSYSVNLKEIVNSLHNAGKTLKTHTGIYVFLSKLGVIAVTVVVELRENVVPDFHKSIAIASGLALGRTAAVLNSAVKINLRARTART